LLFAFANVDSANYIITYFDSLTIQTTNNTDSNFEFSVQPQLQKLLPGSSYFLPEFLKRQEHAITYLKSDDTLIHHSVIDSNVAYVSAVGYVNAKDSGSTQIIYTYKGKSDTLTIIIDAGETAFVSVHPSNTNSCPGDDLFFIAKGLSGSTYQWQVDSGNGYTNLSNNGLYKGVSKDTLWLNQPPHQWQVIGIVALFRISKEAPILYPPFCASLPLGQEQRIQHGKMQRTGHAEACPMNIRM
jgi:hypothetical protein